MSTREKLAARFAVAQSTTPMIFRTCGGSTRDPRCWLRSARAAHER
jgi:hypothetical protein